MSEIQDILRALEILGINGDRLFDRIRADIERGDRALARANLDFVDQLLKLYKESK